MAKAKMSILNDVKQSIGIVPDYEAFDPQLIICINSVFSTLHQLGCGPSEGFVIDGPNEEWDEYIESDRLNFIRSYVIMKVHVMFDPPTSSIASEAFKSEIDKQEWLINVWVESNKEE